MSRIRTTTRAAAYGGGGLVGLSAGLLGLLTAQAKLARRFIGPADGTPPLAQARWLADGTRRPLPPTPGHDGSLVLAVMGDSLAAGLGADAAEQTPGGAIAHRLAREFDCPIDLVVTATVGAQSQDLKAQVNQLAGVTPHCVVIMIGANDVTHRVLPKEGARLLDETLEALTATGATVVVGTCPDLGTVRPIPHPLRFVCRQWSRSLASRQAQAVLNHGSRAVSLGEVLGPEFTANPHELFGPDRFHPSPIGYEAAAQALLPDVRAALSTLTTDRAERAGAGVAE